MRSQTGLLLTAILVLTADQLTKLWVRQSLAVGESVPQDGFLRFTHVTNDGIVFGLSVHPVVPLILSVAVVAAILFLFRHYALTRHTPVNIALGLFLGGSLGNLIDRLAFGEVTDFIDINLWGDYHWPSFNLADTALVVGIILLIYFWIRHGPAFKHS